MGDDGTSCSWWILNFLLFSVWFRLTFLAYEYLCTVGVWHIILVVHIHILDIIVVLLSENALLCGQFCVLCLFPSWFKKKEKHTEEEGTF